MPTSRSSAAICTNAGGVSCRQPLHVGFTMEARSKWKAPQFGGRSRECSSWHHQSPPFVNSTAVGSAAAIPPLRKRKKCDCAPRQFGWLGGSEPICDDIFPQIMPSEQAPRINRSTGHESHAWTQAAPGKDRLASLHGTHSSVGIASAVRTIVGDQKLGKWDGNSDFGKM